MPGSSILGTAASELGAIILGIATADGPISPAGIAPIHAVGAPAVHMLNELEAAGIGPPHAVGSPALSPGNVDVSPDGIAPAHAVGTPAKIFIGHIAPDGIAPPHAVGTPILGRLLYATGIAPPHAVGSPGVTSKQYITLQFLGIKSRGLGIPRVQGGAGALSLAVKTVDRTSILKVESARIERRTAGQSTAQMELIVSGSGNSPAIGDTVRLQENSYLYFGGQIDEVRESILPYTDTHSLVCKCVDWTSITMRRLVTVRSYRAGAAVYDVVLDIVARALSGEGITTVNVDAEALGVLSEDVAFDYVKVQEAFVKIATLTGCVWWVDYNKDLHFTSKARAAYSPISLTPTSDNWANLTVTRSRKNYRNKQYVRSNLNLLTGLTKVTDCWTFIHNRVPDILCPTTYPFTSEPQVRENGITITGTPRLFGIGMFDLIVDPFGNVIQAPNAGQYPAEGWYWIMNGGGIYHWPPDQDPAYGTVICVDSYGTSTFVQNVAVAQDDAEIAARAAAEGGSGLYEEIVEEKNVATFEEAVAMAQGILGRAGYIDESIQFETVRPGVDILTKIPVALPELDLADDYLVDAMTLQSAARDLGHGSSFRTQITLVEKQTLGDYIAWYERLLARTRATAVDSPTERVVWTLAADMPGSTNPGLATGNVMGPYIVQKDGHISKVTAIFGAPLSGTIVCDILRTPAGTFTSQSIFNGARLSYGAAAVNTVVTYANFWQVFPAIHAGDLLQLVVLQVGAPDPGQNGTIILEMV